ncbi:peptidoglycan-binding protein [Dactylosporangium sp. NPDC048998]|uniref:peptidoglycan-binding protein n=1 Tax=Dactylosporangium sp. NPDC048998 TaxID=3363976 RepID=UPI0037233940
MSRRAGYAAALAVLVAGAGAAAWLGLGGHRAAGEAARSALPPNTAQVSRRTLKDTRTVDGELGYGASSTVTGRLPGTLTYLPDSGTQVTRGQPLYRVNDKPVTLLYGAVPAWRPLAQGTEGADVRQLEENLRALGYTGFTVDDEYTSATAAAVKRWQSDQGLDETGTVELGRVVFVPDAVRITAVAASQGEPAAPGQRILTYTGTAKAVTVALDPADQRLAQQDAAVVVTLPDDGTIGGRVTRVTTVIEPAAPGAGASSGAQTKVEVTIALNDLNNSDDQQRVASYALASVDVTFTASEREDVLAVPVAALVSLPDGGYGVEVVEGAASRYVAVKTGLFSGGWVEISGDGVAAGTTVGMPR